MIDPDKRKRAVDLLDAQTKILQQINRDAPLADVLELICLAIEEQGGGMLCSVLLLDEDGEHLTHGAAPSLPNDYCEAVDGLSIGPTVGSCGTAAFTGMPCIVEDITSHPNWTAFKGLAHGVHGLRSCWSTPIRSDDGDVVATFAIYSREPKSPSLEDRKLIDFSAHLVGIAVNRHKEMRSLAGKAT